jgi:type II secretion system protein N
MNLGGALKFTPDRLRRLRGIGLRLGFGLLVYVIAFYVAFPYHRIKEQVIALASMRNLDVEIGAAGPALGMGLTFSDIVVMTRPPPSAGGKPTRFKIDEAEVLVSPLARLFGENAYSLSAEAMGGDIDVDWEASKSKGKMKIRAQDVAMAQVPGVKESINLPLGGTLELNVDLATPNNKNAEAAGSLSWTCRSCAIGDGKSKLKIAGNPMLSEGLSLPQVRLGDFAGKVNFEKGVGKLQAVQARSADGEIAIEGEIRLADPIRYSQLDLYIRFKPSETLLKRADTVKMMLQMFESMGKRPDGAYGLRLSGTFSRIGPVHWSKTSPFAGRETSAAPRSSGSSGGGLGMPRIPTGRTPPSAPRYDQPVDPAANPSANLPRYPSEPPTPPPTPVAPSEPAPPSTAGAPTEAVIGAQPGVGPKDAL